jgi:hypothetical protein
MLNDRFQYSDLEVPGYLHSISLFSRFVFDEFIGKAGEIVHKVGWTLANRVVERRNMINDYLRGRACIESVRGSFFQGEC